ncbi:hypothetical protein NLG42_19905 [Flavobacterium plurextorum]|uniref:hypothetical protein n=1 Tax=Flavobacterium TaxID=237 RepID=UPI00214D7FC5|nr:MULTISPECIES: hypothetical protein [Flavobacterium]UUW08361.1 hypothetical protein NLG42_19905 [Flavobacterium plurextorum]
MKRIREFFWPLLDKVEPKTLKIYTLEDINVNNENIDKVLDLTQRTFDEELSRSSSVETKSSLFIGTLSVVTSVVIAVTTALINKNDFSISLLSIVVLLFVLIVYMIRTIWFSIKVLERRSFHTMHHNNYLLGDEKIEFSKKLIVQLINKTNQNTDTANSKVNNMVMAQEYFKRAIIVLLLYSGLLLIFFIEKSSKESANTYSRIVTAANSIYINCSLLWLTLLLLMASLLLNVILYRKLKKIKSADESQI